jgi:hypothetical protein
VTLSTLLSYSSLGVGGPQRFYNAIQQKKMAPTQRSGAWVPDFSFSTARLVSKMRTSGTIDEKNSNLGFASQKHPEVTVMHP